MEDPYSSVENMLRWQIDLARKKVVELRDAFSKCGELYPLPKPTDGMPDSWISAHGNLTVQQVALAHVTQGLNWVSHQIEKAENALMVGDVPSSISWIINANQSISSTNAQWVSLSAVRTYRYVGNYRKNQSIKASRNRGKINNYGETIREIVEVLAVSRQHLEEKAKELWPHFFAELDSRGLDPEEINHPDPNKSAYEYDFGDKRKLISFGQFANLVSNSRTGKKSG